MIRLASFQRYRNGSTYINKHSINVKCHINGLKNKNQKIISVGAKRAFDKNPIDQHLKKVGIEGT